jgi:hypothetical protein
MGWFAYKVRWKFKISMRVKMFLWLILRKKYYDERCVTAWGEALLFLLIKKKIVAQLIIKKPR